MRVSISNTFGVCLVVVLFVSGVCRSFVCIVLIAVDNMLCVCLFGVLFCLVCVVGLFVLWLCFFCQSHVWCVCLVLFVCGLLFVSVVCACC